MMSLSVPHPDSLGSCNLNISVAIDFDPVGNSVAFASGFFSKDAPVAERAVWAKIIDTNVSLLAVVHVETLAVRRKGQAIGLGEFFREKRDSAAGVETEDSLEW